MCAASSEQLSVRNGTEDHVNQKNRHISNIENHVGTTEQSSHKWDGLLSYTVSFGLVSHCLVCWVFLRRNVSACDGSVQRLCRPAPLWISGTGLCVRVCSCHVWAHRSAASPDSLCHTDASASEPQTLPLKRTTRRSSLVSRDMENKYQH